MDHSPLPDSLARLLAALADRYPIERELGAGGMAMVYLARDLKHERMVALKVLRPELGAILGVERFLSEIRVTARLQHPLILPLFDSGQVEGLIYYVMPHVEGETLRSRLDRERQLPIREAVDIAKAVASALDYAHRQGVIHRDIKPENILFQDGQAVVADFGIALALTAAAGKRLTETGLSLGTPYYMSPEQATGDRHVDVRTDIYSLGCVLYEMLAGETPYSGPSAQAIVARILTERPRELRVIRESVPPALERVVAKSLSRLPADRYATAAKFSEALTSAGEEPWAEPPAARGVTTGSAAVPGPALRGRRRLMRVAPWVVAMLALIAAAFSWLRPHLARSGVDTGEVSTEEFQQILAADQAIVLDSRPHLEYAISHIPGALNVAARPGVPQSMYVSDVAEVGRLVGGDLNRAIVLYCNGPYCPKSKRLQDELAMAGYTNVRRYQLGIPVWRAFGGVTVIEADGLRHVLANDRTAVVLDLREADAYRLGTIPGARNLPRSGVLDARDAGEVRRAKDDGRLPMTDHNTRIIVIGRAAGDARFVAQALAGEAFHNVAYFPGTFEEARAVLAQ
jgi:rhodanese-related sulfurtransferase